MGFVEDKQRSGGEGAEPVPETGHVGFVRQQGMGDQEAGTEGPRIGGETPGAADLRHVFTVHGGECQTEFGFQLVLPLRDHPGGRGDQHEIQAASQEHFPQDQAGLDRLPQADVIRDKQVDARQAEGLA